MRRLRCRRDDFPREDGIAHQCAAVAVSGDLRRGTTHVEVDAEQCFSQILLHDGDRLGQRLRFTAEELHAIRRVAFLRQIQRAGLLAHKEQSFCADHLAGDHVGAALPAQQAKRPVGKPRHRRQANSRPPRGKESIYHGASVGFGVGVAAGTGDSFGSGVPRLAMSGFSSNSVNSEMYQRAFMLMNLIL